MSRPANVDAPQVQAAEPHSPPEPATAATPRGAYLWGVLRLAMGWIFLWAFLDKLLALGFATGRDPETGRRGPPG
jgi:thiosulfate dehydrogenase [quinone] large subunit